ncbi:MAG: hypothetical protein KC547_18925 [Anaerolineae bacterium]|nr:hypothetical protein [Anaerolineae bacterium]
MATNTLPARAQSGLVPAITYGVAGGLVGGIVFGIMMQMMGAIPMVAMLVGSESVVVGWVVHLLISAVIGAVYGVVAARLPSSWGITLAAGVVNGIVWWVLGALILMPLMLGMGEMVLRIEQMQINSLIGHVIFGVIAAAVFRTLYNRA